MNLLPEERSRLSDRPTNDLVAYDHYLRGLASWRRSQERKDVEDALLGFEAAAARDPGFAPAQAGLAKTHLAMRWYRYDDGDEQLLKARAAAETAARLRPDHPESHLALGYLRYWGYRDYPGAIEEFEQVRSRRPDDPDALQGLGYVLRRLGRWEESAARLTEARKLDPRNANLLSNQAQSLTLCRRYSEAEDAWSLAIAASPDFGIAQAQRAWLQIRWKGDVARALTILSEAEAAPGRQDATGRLALVAFRVALARGDLTGALGRLDTAPATVLSSHWWFLPVDLLRSQVHALAGRQVECRRTAEAARTILEAELEKHPEDTRVHEALGTAYALEGRNEDALRSARRAVELMPASKDAWFALLALEDLALVCTMTGRHDEAIEHVGTLLAASGEFTPHVLRLDPRFEPLRKNPKLEALLAKYEVRP
jgi:tetratricopeptide (TPR) repeat protein